MRVRCGLGGNSDRKTCLYTLLNPQHEVSTLNVVFRQGLSNALEFNRPSTSPLICQIIPSFPTSFSERLRVTVPAPADPPKKCRPLHQYLPSKRMTDVAAGASIESSHSGPDHASSLRRLRGNAQWIAISHWPWPRSQLQPIRLDVWRGAKVLYCINGRANNPSSTCMQVRIKTAATSQTEDLGAK
jgi:hypothetical protein